MNVKTMILASSLIASMLTILFMSFNEKAKAMKSQKTSFECGFLNMEDKKMMFSTNFILMVMLFIMFDIEVSIMIPMLMKSNSSQQEMLIPLSFITGLTLILLKEWSMGTMEWTK